MVCDLLCIISSATVGTSLAVSANYYYYLNNNLNLLKFFLNKN